MPTKEAVFVVNSPLEGAVSSNQIGYLPMGPLHKGNALLGRRFPVTV